MSYELHHMNFINKLDNFLNYHQEKLNYSDIVEVLVSKAVVIAYNNSKNYEDDIADIQDCIERTLKMCHEGPDI